MKNDTQYQWESANLAEEFMSNDAETLRQEERDSPSRSIL